MYHAGAKCTMQELSVPQQELNVPRRSFAPSGSGARKYKNIDRAQVGQLMRSMENLGCTFPFHENFQTKTFHFKLKISHVSS